MKNIVGTQKISIIEAKNYIEEFKNNFPKNFHKPIHIYLNLANDIFENGTVESVDFYLTQKEEELFLYVKQKDQIFRISDIEQKEDITDKLVYFSQKFEANFGKNADSYLKNRNTRRITVAKNFYEYFLSNAKSMKNPAMIFYPSICTLDENLLQMIEYVETEVTYKNRFTFVMTIGEKDGEEKSVYDYYDRNYLCPPSTSNC